MMKQDSTIKKISFLASALVLGTLTLSGCTNSTHKEPNVELIQDMMDQPALKAQDYEPSAPLKGSSRLPPEGAVPRGFSPYPYHNDVAMAEKMLKNPVAGQLSPEILSVGQKKFETYCLVCHGPQGHGDGPVSEKMVLKPANLVGEKILAVNDAHIFHVITDGYGGMASYIYQIPNDQDRWAIVNYVRSLQKLANKK